jgi:hypothetical protein
MCLASPLELLKLALIPPTEASLAQADLPPNVVAPPITGPAFSPVADLIDERRGPPATVRQFYALLSMLVPHSCPSFSKSICVHVNRRISGF